MMIFKIINENPMAKYLLYHFKVLGLAPMTVDKNKNNLLEYSKLGTAYNVFLCIFFSTLNVFSIAYFYHHYDMAYRNEFEKTFNCLQDSLNLFTAILVWSTFIFHQKKAATIVNKIYQIRQSAMLIDFNLYQRIPLISRVLIIVLVILISWCAMTTTVCMYGLSYLSNAFPIYLSLLISVSTVLQYCVVLKYLKKLFTFVNEKLSMESKCFRVENSRMKSNTLEPVSRVYMSLREISRSLSGFYSPLMLLSILNIFLGCISSTYYIVKPFVFEENRSPRLFFAHCVALGIVHAVLLIVLTTCVTMTTKETTKTGEIVSTYLMTCKNPEVERKLDQFSSYLILNKVEFTVFRLFALDQSLLMSIIGSTTTYLVILLQLQDN